MKKHLYVVTFLAMFLAVSFSVTAEETSWKLKKDEAGIQAYVRKVEGSSILEYKGTVTVDAGLEAVVTLFEEDARITEWFHQCAEARPIKAISPEEKVLYFVISMPWPVKDRDLVSQRIRSKDSATGAVEYRTSSLPEAYPEQDGKVRMPYLKGLWRFTPLADGRTEIYYQQHSEVGGNIPAWLVNKLAVNIPFESLSRFRQLLSESGPAR